MIIDDVYQKYFYLMLQIRREAKQDYGIIGTWIASVGVQCSAQYNIEYISHVAAVTWGHIPRRCH